MVCDESTDIESNIHVGILCALYLPKNATACELYKVLNEYFTGKLNWSFCVGLWTDGSGLTARIKEVASKCEATYCVIHREMLASRKISPELHSVFNDVVKMINPIKTYALNTRLFEYI